jgi:hypothetical protein
MPSLAIAHFTLGSLLQGFGDLDGARRSLRNAITLAAGQPAGEIALPNDGQPAPLPASAARNRPRSVSGVKIQ